MVNEYFFVVEYVRCGMKKCSNVICSSEKHVLSHLKKNDKRPQTKSH